MKERPILFSGPMVRAILDGRKTMTRRVVKPQPIVICGKDGRAFMSHNPTHYDDGSTAWTVAHRDTENGHNIYTKCPYGQPGDRLWVRETWATSKFMDKRAPSETKDKGLPFWFRADNSVMFTGATTGGTDFMERGRWRPSIHMPRWASRIALEITAVRVERVQDITEADARAEGINNVDGFRALWDTINQSRGFGWSANSYCWVIGFRRLT